MSSGAALAVILSVTAFQTPATAGAPLRPQTTAALVEAARLAHEAERIQSEADEQVEAGADRKVVDAAQAHATFLFAKGVDLWCHPRRVQRSHQLASGGHALAVAGAVESAPIC